MNIQKYLTNITELYEKGKATEHSYRGDLQSLIKNILSDDITVTNEPKRIKCGAPDYILTKKDIIVGYIEAKKIGDPDLDGKKKNKAQFDRYKNALQNLIFTDYLVFHFYRGEHLLDKISIAKVTPQGKIKTLPENFTRFENLIKDFSNEVTQSIANSELLAKMMAGKARLLSDVIEKALKSDEENRDDSTLKDQMTAFKDILIHDITPKQFADMYAQTITYGMFAARLRDDTLKTFSRIKAAKLIPHSNPFLRKFFGHIAGIDIDTRIEWIVDDLVEIFLHSDVHKLLRGYGRETQMEDPIIHFYEDFLTAYDPALRKARGVWYTPAPVVKFIVQAVDDVLKNEFDLSDGLANASKTTVSTPRKEGENYKTQQKEIHRVQILDPATGTGTFLSEVVRQIHQKFKGQEGIWSGYVADDLIPRLNGFEILMASYAMVHLQLDLLLQETGFIPPKKSQRKNICLVNSLEEPHPEIVQGFLSGWLKNEANEANRIKNETPVMCVLGNPPYSGISSNNGKWITDLINDYKYVDGVHFKERKHWLNDDYVKFIRFGQYFIEKNKSGVLAYINPHGFLDNPTFRGMRWQLLKAYDKIYTIDLHGNNKKKETAPDGSKDENVFDIMQGVSINIFVKTGKKKANQLGKIFHYDLYGKRKNKYDFLNHNTLETIPFQKLPNIAPHYFFAPKNFENKKAYEKGVRVDELFKKNVTGIVSMGDKFAFSESKSELKNRLKEFINNDLTESELKTKFSLGKNYAEFICSNKEKLNIENEKIIQCSYRPFDNRFTYFDNKILWRWRYETMQHFLKGDNLGLALCKQFKTGDNYLHAFITNKVIESSYVSNRTSEITSAFPLYTYPENDALFKTDRTPNFKQEIIKDFASGLGLRFTPEKDTSKNTFAPIDVLDYIYAVLHSPTYREKYREFLKIDFPRVPYPTDTTNFWALVKLGGRLRKVHLLDFDKELRITYPKNGDNKITRKLTKNNIGYEALTETHGRVWINDEQYFEGVPLIAWEFFIGGYQPAQKWLKDRKEKTLSCAAILHYRKIILALTETDKLMKEIDKVGVLKRV